MACQNDEMMDPDDEMVMNEILDFEFSFSTSGSPFTTQATYLLIKDHLGNVLYDSLGTDYDLDIRLELDTGTIVNVTAAYLRDDMFEIYSYVDVASGSRLVDLAEWEGHPCFRSEKVRTKSNAKLYITDIEGVDESFNSFSHSELTELAGDTLVIMGYAMARFKGDNQIVLKESGGSQLKSLIIDAQEWIWVSETQSMEHTVSFNDFTETQEYAIDLSEEDLWGVNATVCDANGKLTALQCSVSSGSEYQEGDHIRVFMNEALNHSELKLHFYSNAFPSGYSYNWFYEEIPESIELDEDFEPQFFILRPNEFWLNSTSDYTFNVAQYNYSLDQMGGSCWKVLSRGGQDVRFKLPDLPENLIDEFPYISDLIKDPNSLTNYMIRPEESLKSVTDLNTAIVSGNNTPDENYAVKRTHIQF